MSHKLIKYWKDFSLIWPRPTLLWQLEFELAAANKSQPASPPYSGGRKPPSVTREWNGAVLNLLGKRGPGILHGLYAEGVGGVVENLDILAHSNGSVAFCGLENGLDQNTSNKNICKTRRKYFPLWQSEELKKNHRQLKPKNIDEICQKKLNEKISLQLWTYIV